MGMAAILGMWPGPFEQTIVSPSQGDSIQNLASIGPVVSEEKMFENIYTLIRTTAAYLYYKLTNEPKGSGELKIAAFRVFIEKYERDILRHIIMYSNAMS